MNNTKYERLQQLRKEVKELETEIKRGNMNMCMEGGPWCEASGESCERSGGCIPEDCYLEEDSKDTDDQFKGWI